MDFDRAFFIIFAILKSYMIRKYKNVLLTFSTDSRRGLSACGGAKLVFIEWSSPKQTLRWCSVEMRKDDWG